MPKPFVVVLHGGPGVGKTTIVRRLAKDLGLGVLAKDDIKELLLDQLDIKDRDESRHLGSAVARSLYTIADSMIAAGKSFIMESAFNHEFANQDFAELRDKHDAQFVQIFCFTDSATQRERFVSRIKNGKRHPRHYDTEEEFVKSQRTHTPLNIQPLINVDTTNLGEEEYKGLLAEVKAVI